MSTATLNGKTAIVTGGGQGMGRTMALGLVRAGVRVAIVDLDDGALGGVAGSPGGETGRCVPDDRRRCDAGGQRDPGVKETMEAFGRVDILVSNAGIGQETIRRDFLVAPLKFWEVEPAR